MKFIIGHIVLFAIILCLLSHFEAPQSSCLPMSILKILSMSLSQSSCLHVFISKPCLPMCLKVHVCLCLFQFFLSTSVYVKALVYQCMFQSFCLPLLV
jgi:hypothetical protein